MIDLNNRGCPQRTAHYTWDILDLTCWNKRQDRDLICNIGKKAPKEVSKPISVKNAGASLIAIHARYNIGPRLREKALVHVMELQCWTKL